MPDHSRLVRDFLAAGPYAVAGASNDRSKFGNKVLRAYLSRGIVAYPVHPSEKVVEDVQAYPDVASLPEKVRGLSIVTPPPVTEKLVEQAAKAGITRLWMQPGAESAAAIRRAGELGLTVIAGGPCVLVELGGS
jgi:uncharacterized protein